MAFESDCREGICGTCGITVNGRPHGAAPNSTTCQQHVRSFKDGATVRLEPFRSAAYQFVKDLIVDRSALDRVIEAGGFVSVDAGTDPDADTVEIPHDVAETALNFAACIGCGACVAACPNGSGNLFTGAKLAHLSLLPHGRQNASAAARSMGEDRRRVRPLRTVRRVRTSLSGRNPDHHGRRPQPRAAARLGQTLLDARRHQESKTH